MTDGQWLTRSSTTRTIIYSFSYGDEKYFLVQLTCLSKIFNGGKLSIMGSSHIQL